MSAPHSCSSLSLFLPSTPATATGPRLAPVPLVSHLRSCRPRPPPSFVRVAMTLPTPDGWEPLPTTPCYRPPHQPPPPRLLLLPPPHGRVHTDPHPFPSLPRHRAAFKTNAGATPCPFSAPFSSHPRPSHQSCASPSRGGILVALPSTGALSSVGIWSAPPLSSLSSVRHPLSLSSPNPRPSLTSLSLSPSDLQGASPIVEDHWRPPLSSEHR
jgi:hypothetical protein